MTVKNQKRTLDNELDTRWRNKGHPHVSDKKSVPEVCDACKGFGVISSGEGVSACKKCQGLGEL